MDRQPLPVHESTQQQPLPAPPFIPSRFIDNSTYRLYYAFGNTPAEDLLEHVPDFIDIPSVLQLGCGDMRSCLYTLWKNFDKHSGHGNFKGVLFHQNDYSAAILARNVLFIHLILKLGNLISKRADILEIKQMVSSIWNIWFCHDLHHAQFVLLKDSLNELSEFFSDEKSWCNPSNQLKSLFEFSTNNGAIKAIHSTFKMWLQMFDFSVKQKAKIKGAKKDISLDHINTFMHLGFYRMAEKAERLQERIGELQKECNSYLKSGNAFAEASFKLANSDNLFLNPTLYERDDQYSLHYSSIPYKCFAQYMPCDHQGFTPLVAKYRGTPLLDNKKANDMCLLSFSLQQFSLWLMSASETLFEAISTQKHSIKFIFSHSDALMAAVQLSHTHKHTFDVIHTSNLIDHLSPIAVVVSTIPLLKKEGILLTTTLTFGKHGFISAHDYVANTMGFELDRLLIFGIQCIGHEGVYAGDGVLVPIPSYHQSFDSFPDIFNPQTLLWKRLTSSTPFCLTNLEANAVITETLYKCIESTTFSILQQGSIALSSIGSCSHTGIRALCLFLNQLSLQSPIENLKFWEELSSFIRSSKYFQPYLLHLQCQALVMNLHMHLVVTDSNCPICNNTSSLKLKKLSLKFTPDYTIEQTSNVNSVVLICVHPNATNPSSLDLSNPALLNPDVFLFDSSPCSVLDKKVMVDLMVLENALKMPISRYSATLIFQHYAPILSQFIAFPPKCTVPLGNSICTIFKLDDTAKYDLLPNPSSKFGRLTLMEYTIGCFKVNIALSDNSISMLDKHSLTTELVSNTEFKVVAKSLSFPLQFSLPIDYNKVSIQLSKKNRLVMINAPCKMFDAYLQDRIPLFYSNPGNTVNLSEVDVSHNMLELSARSQFTPGEMKTLEEFGRDNPNLPPAINMKEVFVTLFQRTKESFFCLVRTSDINGAKYGFIVIHKRCFDVQNQTVALDLSYYIDENGVKDDDGAYYSWAIMRLSSGVPDDVSILINGNEVSLFKDVLTQFHRRTRSQNKSEYPLKGYGLEDYFRRAIVYHLSGTFAYSVKGLLPVKSSVLSQQNPLAKDMCSFCKMQLNPKEVQKCSKCLVAVYCSRSCQLKHWPIHKLSCQEIKANVPTQQPSNTPVDQPTSMNNETEKCFFCKFESSNLRKCSRCKSVAYCSKACQSEHWNEHKKHCKAATPK